MVAEKKKYPFVGEAPKATTPETTSTKEPEEKKVEISEEILKKIIEDNKALREDVERLNYAASKARLDTFDKKHKGDFGKEVRLRSLDGKIISAWELQRNYVDKNPLTGVWEEHQDVKLYFFDTEESLVLDYRTLERSYIKVPAMVVEETKQSNGVTLFKVKTDDGKEYTIDVRFVN